MPCENYKLVTYKRGPMNENTIPVQDRLIRCVTDAAAGVVDRMNREARGDGPHPRHRVQLPLPPGHEDEPHRASRDAPRPDHAGPGPARLERRLQRLLPALQRPRPAAAAGRRRLALHRPYDL